MTTQELTRQHPRRCTMDRDLAMRLAETEYARSAEALASLTPEQWLAPTDCPAWDVRAMAGHVLGMARMAASVPETLRQQVGAMRRARRDGGLLIDALTALQVDELAALSATELVEELQAVGPRAARGRRRSPAFVRSRTMPGLQETGDGQERWTFGYLLDTILTRDPFLHRVDIARATGTTMQLTAEHDGAIIDDVVAEWGARHGAPYTLTLTGPAGGHWESRNGETLELDALEFCRILSGRSPGTGLLATRVPF